MSKFLILSLLIAFFLPHSASARGLNDGLVGYWTFDGKDTNWMTGQALDKSGNGNTGSLISMSTTTSPTSGKIGQALKFTGNTLVDLSSLASTNWSATDFTFSTWVRFTPVNLSTYNIITSGKNGAVNTLFLSTKADGTGLRMGRTGVAEDANAAYTWIPNTWYHVTLTRQGTTVTFYVNGASIGTTGSVSATYVSTNQILGYDSEGVGFSLEGSLDDVHIYNRALSQTEINQLYKQGIAKVAVSPITSIASGLVGYWTLDGKNTNWATGQISDSSGQSSAGQMIGMSTTTSPSVGKISQALYFDSTNYISVGSPAALNIPGPVTISLWMKAVDYSSGPFQINVLVAQELLNGVGTQYAIEWNRNFSGRLETLANDQTIALTGNTVLGLNKWYHAVMTRTGSTGNWTYTLYVNGAYDGSATTAVNPDPQGPLSIGRYGDYSIPLFVQNTYLDDVRIYNRALSASEVQQLYSQGAVKLGITPAVTPGQGLSKGLIGYWPFDGKSTAWTSASAGTTNDLSGGGYTGTLTNMSRALSVVAGKIGQGLLFDGSDDSITLASHAAFDNMAAVTVSAWVKSRAVKNPFMSIVAKGRDLSCNFESGWAFYMHNESGTPNNLYFCGHYDNGGATFANMVTRSSSINTVTNGTWQFVTATWDGSGTGTNVHLYINGVETSYDTTTNGASNRVDDSSRPLVIGDSQNPGATFDGAMDDVRVYNRVLSAAEIQQLYKQGAGIAH